MKSELPKVLHPMLGRTLLGHVLHAAEAVSADNTMVVVGQAAEQVTAHVNEIVPNARTAFQAEQRGTGHAVRIAMDAAPNLSGTVVVLCGDTPLLQPETLASLLAAHEDGGAAATVLTAEVENPYGLGRILRDSSGAVTGIVEQRDATAEQLKIREINSGMFAFDAQLLRTMLAKLSSDNDQGEEYLTDVLGLLVEAGHPVAGFTAPDPLDTLGCNDRAQLAQLRRIMQGRINGELMRAGVTLDDPETTWIDATVTVEPDVTIHPGVQLCGKTTVARGATVGPDSTLTDTTVGARATVERVHADSAVIGSAAQVGPFAYLRPGTHLGDAAKVGTYVEVENSTIAEGAKVPHLSYVGDASIGRRSNIGAGTIVANYDGVSKHHTEVGESVFVGSNSVLIAPVTVNDGSYVAAGSAIDQEVPSGSIGVARGRQRNVEGWVDRKRSGTKTADAAERAQQASDTP